MSKAQPIFVVTGANRGIGKEIVLSLASKFSQSLIYLTSRSPTAGAVARSEILEAVGSTAATIKLLTLDITSTDSIKAAVSHIASGPGVVDVLINNAGMEVDAFGGPFTAETVQATIDTNYTGTKNVALAFLPLLRDRGRIVNVSSEDGALRIVSPALQKEFTNAELSLKELDGLMARFVSAVAAGRCRQEGWPKRAYAVSKVGVTALARALAREPGVREKGVFVSACDPGWCRTDMGRPSAPFSVSYGAKTPVMLASADWEKEGWVNGEYFADEKPAVW